MGNKNEIIIIVLFMLFLVPAQAYALDEVGENGLLDEQLKELDISPIEEMLKSMNKDIYEYIPELTINNLFTFIKSGNFDYSFNSLLKGIIRYFFKEVIVNFQILGQLIILCVILALLQNIQSAFQRDNVSKLAYGILLLNFNQDNN